MTLRALKFFKTKLACLHSQLFLEPKERINFTQTSKVAIYYPSSISDKDAVIDSYSITSYLLADKTG